MIDVEQMVRDALIAACRSAEDFIRDKPENSADPRETVLAKLRAALMMAGSAPR